MLATALIPIGLLVYVIWLGALRAAFDDVIVFDATCYAGVQAVPFAWDVRQQNLPLACLFPFVAPLTLLTLIWDSACGVSRSHVSNRAARLPSRGWSAASLCADIVHVAFAAPWRFPWSRIACNGLPEAGSQSTATLLRE